MARALLAALVVASAAAAAQTPPSKPAQKPAATSEAKPAPAAPAEQKPAEAKPAEATPAPSTTPAPAPAADAEEIRREVDAKVEQAKKEIRDEIHAQQAAQAVDQGWKAEAAPEPRRKLELFVLDGYFRSRPDLFYKFDMNRIGSETNPNRILWPLSPASPTERTIAGVNMRLRLEPTLNISEEVRLRMQVDVFDNAVWGSTPEYAHTRSERTEFGLLTETQLPPTTGIDAVKDSIQVKRAYGEVSTPVGIFRFGRMGSQWGLGVIHNDGNCLDCDWGDTVDRFEFVAEPYEGWFIAPMIDFDSEGPSSGRAGELGQPYDLSNADEAHSYVLAVARRDTDQQAKAKLGAGKAVINGGFHFTYRTQTMEAVDWANTPYPQTGEFTNYGYVRRGAYLYIPDVWFKWEKKAFRVELEAALEYGHIANDARTAAEADAGHPIDILEYGGVLQGEYRLLDGKLKLNAEVGFASGDKAPGLGNFPRRSGSGTPGGFTQAGDIDGPQYCPAGAPAACNGDYAINNLRFNRDYRIDLILWRELLGGITDAVYARPSASYEIAPGLKVFGAAIYSRTVFASSSPNGSANDLGVEFDVGAEYETEDGFSSSIQWGMLIPMAGLNAAVASPPTLDNPQAIRAVIAVKF